MWTQSRESVLSISLLLMVATRVRREVLTVVADSLTFGEAGIATAVPGRRTKSDDRAEAFGGLAGDNKELAFAAMEGGLVRHGVSDSDAADEVVHGPPMAYGRARVHVERIEREVRNGCGQHGKAHPHR